MIQFRRIQRLLLCMACFSAAPSLAWAAETSAALHSADPRITVKGVVVDQNGSTVIGAVVMIKGNKSSGVITDAGGAFTITVPAGSVLEVSCLGYDTIEVVVKDGKELTIVLKESSEFLEECLVVGYGAQKKESVLGAISQVATESLVNSGTLNITDALTGKISGLTSIQSGGEPGNNDTKLYIRGVSSWNGSAPLVMVDGVEREFSDLDPNEVATISVLKDASATAVFGAKGANGVILVTTRTGEIGKPKMTASVSYGMDFPTGIPDHVSSAETAALLNVARRNVGSYGSMLSNEQISEYASPSSRVNSLRYPDNDWFNLLMKDFSQSYNANFSISGGDKIAKYFISLGFQDQGSVIKDFSNWGGQGFTYNRLNYRSNLNLQVTKTTEVAIKVGGSISTKNTPSAVTVSNLFNYMYSSSPMMYPAYFPAWSLEEIKDTDYPEVTGDRISYSKGGNAYFGNPLAQMCTGSFTKNGYGNLYTDITLNQNLDFITEGLSFKTDVSLTSYFSRIKEESAYTNPSFYINWDIYDAGTGNPWVYSAASEYVYEQDPYSVSTGGVYNDYYLTFYWEAALNYARTFNSTHNVTGLLLFNQKSKTIGSNFPYRSMGLVGRLTYDYLHRYLIEFNIGYTGSEQFAPAKRFGVFPSLAVGWNMAQEEWWMHAMPWWSRMKIRYSDGIVGSDSSSQRWLYYSSYSKSGNFIYEDAAANEVAQWEEAHKRDLGFEMGWLKNRLTLNVDLFNEYRDHMLVSPNVTMLVGASYKNVNRGSMKKHGIDMELGWADKLSNGFSYNVGAMLSLNENRIVNFEDAPYAPDYQKTAGKPYQGQTNGVSLVDSGYYTSVDDIHNYPSYSSNWDYVNVGSYKYLDYAVDGSLNANDLHAILGSQYPPVIGSFNLGCGWKGFEFRMSLYGNYGKYVEYNKSWEIEFNKGDYKVTASQLDYWRPDNQNASHATLVYGGASGHPMYFWAGGSGDNGAAMMLEGHTWRKADYIDLKEVYLGYTFNSSKFKKATGMRSLNVYLTGNNVYVLTNLLEGDPQSTTLKNGYYPQMACWKLGVKMGF